MFNTVFMKRFYVILLAAAALATAAVSCKKLPVKYIMILLIQKHVITTPKNRWLNYVIPSFYKITLIISIRIIVNSRLFFLITVPAIPSDYSNILVIIKKTIYLLKNKVVIEGKEEDIEIIYITDYYMKWYPTTSPKVLVIPEGFEAIVSLTLPRLEKLYIPKTVSRTHDICTCVYANINCENLKSIVVDKRNRYLKSVDGVLFSKNGKDLFLYPNKKQGKTFEIPKRVEHILLGAFDKCQLERIYFPKSKKEMVYYYQFGYDKLDTDAKEALESMGFEDPEKIKFIGR